VRGRRADPRVPPWFLVDGVLHLRSHSAGNIKHEDAAEIQRRIKAERKASAASPKRGLKRNA